MANAIILSHVSSVFHDAATFGYYTTHDSLVALGDVVAHGKTTTTHDSSTFLGYPSVIIITELILRQVRPHLPIPPRTTTMVPVHASLEPLAHTHLDVTPAAPTDPKNHVDLNRKVDTLTKRFEDQNKLVGQLLDQIDLIRDFVFRPISEEIGMDKCISEYRAGGGK
ncbi:unnamed protein product [Prunus armeniaca]